MVKILEIEAQLDGDQDDDCCEIDPAEFAKKVQLKDSDDVVILATKGQIQVKLEANQPEELAKTLCGDLHGYVSGDRMDIPYVVDEDHTTPLNTENAEAFVLEKLSANNRTGGAPSDGKCIDVDEDKCRFEHVVPDKSPPKFECFEKILPEKLLVKCEPDDCNATDESVDEDAYDHLPELDGFIRRLYPGGRVFDEEDDDDVVVVTKESL